MRHGSAVRTVGRTGARAPGPNRDDADLARCGELELQRSEQAVAALVGAARAVVTAAAHDPDRIGCHGAGCRLAGTDDPTGPQAPPQTDQGATRRSGQQAARPAGDQAARQELCALAHRLALLADAPAVQGVLPAPAAIAAFQRAITGAVEAVQRCRVTRHAEGRCRFSPVPGHDGCAAVLQAAHRLG
jgi:hypothetical protein